MQDSIDGPHIEYRDFKFKKRKLTHEDYENQPATLGPESYPEPSIGKFLVTYSSLIGSVRRWVIPQLLNIRHERDVYDYSIAYSITGKMQDIDCFNLAAELCMRVSRIRDDNYSQSYTKQFSDLKKMFAAVCKMRNVIAHTVWFEPCDDFWYLTRPSHNATTGENDYLFHKLSQQDFDDAIEYIKYVDDSLQYATYEYVMGLKKY